MRFSMVMVLAAALTAGTAPPLKAGAEPTLEAGAEPTLKAEAEPAGAAAAPRVVLVAQRGEARTMSLDEAVALVARRTGGKVLSAETVTRGGDRVHRIRVLVREGHVRVYEVDPETGAVE